jgi:transcriptional regulator
VVSDAPEGHIRSLLGRIVGVRLTIDRIEGRRKPKQRASLEDRRTVANRLAGSGKAADRRLAPLVPVDDPVTPR